MNFEQKQAEIRLWQDRLANAQAMASSALKSKVRAHDRGDFQGAGEWYFREMEASRLEEQAIENIARLTATLSIDQTELVLGGPF